MDILYSCIKGDVLLAIERSAFATYAKIDFRNADTSGSCVKKYVSIYRRLLTELNFTIMLEDKDIFLFVCKDKKAPASNFIKETIDDRIIQIEREYV